MLDVQFADTSKICFQCLAQMLRQQSEESIPCRDRNARRNIVQQFLSLFPLGNIQRDAYASAWLSLAIVNSFASRSQPRRVPLVETRCCMVRRRGPRVQAT